MIGLEFNPERVLQVLPFVLRQQYTVAHIHAHAGPLTREIHLHGYGGRKRYDGQQQDQHTNEARGFLHDSFLPNSRLD